MVADRDWLVEQRYLAVQEVLSCQPVSEVAVRFGVSRETVYVWKRRYLADGLGGLRELSRRPRSSPTRLSAPVEAQVCEMRRTHRRWGARRIAFELARAGTTPTPSRATVHRVLVRNGLVEAHPQRHKRKYRSWEREQPMQLWQLDIVDGMRLLNGRGTKIVTGIDDHSRFVVIATVIARPTGRAVCAAFTAAMQHYGVPDEVLSDNGKQFTGRFTKPRPVEVLFERTCRLQGIEQHLTKVRSPTTTGKVERFHRSLQEEFLDHSAAFADIATAQAALDAWIHTYNHQRPHQALDMATPASYFHAAPPPAAVPATMPPPDREGDPLSSVEVPLTVPPSGAVSLAGHQEVWIGRAFARRTVLIWADQRSIHVSYAGEHLKTVPSRLSAEDLYALTRRGARPAGPAPAASALDQPDTVIEVHRTATRDGVVRLGGVPVAVGASVAGQRIALRLDGHLLHVIAAGRLVRTMPSPIPADHQAQLIGAQRTTTPLPPPPAGPVVIRRRVPNDGIAMVSGQRLRVGRLHAGKTVTIAVEDTYYRVTLDGEELSTHPRANHQPIRTTKHHAPRITS